MEHIIEFLDKLITQFSWRRLLFVLTALFIVVVCVTVFELYTSHFRLSRLERCTTVLTTLLQQSEQIAKTNDHGISKIHGQLLAELQKSLGENETQLAAPTWLLKAAAAIAPWFLLGIVMYFVTDEEFSKIIGGMLVITIPVTFVGAIIPDFRSQWINYIVYPLGVFIVIVVPMFIYGHRKTPSKTAKR